MGRKARDIISGLFCRRCGDEGIAKASDTTKGGSQRYSCLSCKSRQTKPYRERPQLLPKFSKERASKYIVTSVMSETDLLDGLMDTLETIAESIGARIITIGTVETNPNLATRGSPLRFPDRVLPYLCREKFEINKNLIVRGDFSIEHAVINPLAGANHCGGTESEIFGHAQTAMEMVPTPKNSIPKGLYTTGTVSIPKYKNSARAKKAEFHHTYGALLIEVKGQKFWPTQLPWDGSGISLFGKYYKPCGVEESDPPAAIVYGDIHEDQLSKQERNCLMRLIDGAKADYNVLHDILDFHTGSHHKTSDTLLNLRRPSFDVRKELDAAVKFVDSVENAVVVSSNHNDHLDQWFNSQDPRKLTYDLDLYSDLMNIAKRTNSGLFESYCVENNVQAEFTSPNEEYSIMGVDVSQHGHKGPNGCRGSAKGFARTGRKTIVGHSHTPGIFKGTYQVGTSSMGMAYATGYSSWMVCHAIIAQSGKRSLITALNNKFSPMVEEWIMKS